MSEWCFFIGPGKTGSTWLYNNLINHPDIKLAKNIKESNYYFRGDSIDDFKNLFYNYGKSKKINMDISNTYIYNETIAHKIKKNHPNAKIIIGYREPFERLKSMYLFKKRNGEIPQGFSLKKSLENDAFNLILHSKYYDLSLPYLNEFGVKNIFIFNFKKIQNEPDSLLKDLMKFLEISEYLEIDKLYKITNPASSYRIKILSQYSQKISNFLRDKKLYFLLNFIKTNRVIQNILFKKINVTEEISVIESFKEFENKISSDIKKFKSIFFN